MNQDVLSAWLSESPEHARAFVEEGLIVDASEAICEALERRNLTKAALAERLGTSKAHVTQLLNGSRNMTLRTFAGIAFSLEMNPTIYLEDPVMVRDWTTSENVVWAKSQRPAFVDACVVSPAADWTDPLPVSREVA